MDTTPYHHFQKTTRHQHEPPSLPRLYKTLLRGGHFPRRLNPLSDLLASLPSTLLCPKSAVICRKTEVRNDGHVRRRETFLLVEMVETFIREWNEQKKAELKEWSVHGKAKAVRLERKRRSPGEDLASISASYSDSSRTIFFPHNIQVLKVDRVRR